MRKFFFGGGRHLATDFGYQIQREQLGSTGQFLAILMGQISSPIVNTKANYCQKFISNIQSGLKISAVFFLFIGN